MIPFPFHGLQASFCAASCPRRVVPLLLLRQREGEGQVVVPLQREAAGVADRADVSAQGAAGLRRLHRPRGRVDSRHDDECRGRRRRVLLAAAERHVPARAVARREPAAELHAHPGARREVLKRRRLHGERREVHGRRRIGRDRLSGDLQRVRQVEGEAPLDSPSDDRAVVEDEVAVLVDRRAHVLRAVHVVAGAVVANAVRRDPVGLQRGHRDAQRDRGVRGRLGERRRRRRDGGLGGRAQRVGTGGDERDERQEGEGGTRHGSGSVAWGWDRAPPRARQRSYTDAPAPFAAGIVPVRPARRAVPNA
jgi:hypothetical protein